MTPWWDQKNKVLPPTEPTNQNTTRSPVTPYNGMRASDAVRRYGLHHYTGTSCVRTWRSLASWRTPSLAVQSPGQGRGRWKNTGKVGSKQDADRKEETDQVHRRHEAEEIRTEWRSNASWAQQQVQRASRNVQGDGREDQTSPEEVQWQNHCTQVRDGLLWLGTSEGNTRA